MAGINSCAHLKQTQFAALSTGANLVGTGRLAKKLHNQENEGSEK